MKIYVKPPIQKRSILLFELLVALSLIVLCLYPLVKPHASMRKNDARYLEEMQLERIAQVAFCKLKEELYTQKHTWKDLTRGCTGELGTFFLVTGIKTKKEIPCRYEIKKKEVSSTKNRKIALVVKIKLAFTLSETRQQIFHHTLFLEQHEVAL